MLWEREAALGDYVHEQCWDSIIPEELEEIVEQYVDDVIEILVERHRERFLEAVEKVALKGRVLKLEQNGVQVEMMVQVDYPYVNEIPRLEALVSNKLLIPAALAEEVIKGKYEVLEKYGISEEQAKEVVKQCKEEVERLEKQRKLQLEKRKMYGRLHLGKCYVIQL